MERAVDLIVVLYNNAEFFFKHNYSTLRKNNINIIAVDNNDNSKLMEEFSDTQYIKTPGNIGYGSAVNAGFSAVKSPYTIVCNDDVILYPGSIKGIIKRIPYYSSRYSIVGFNVYSPNSRRRGIHRAIYNPYVILYHNSFIPAVLSLFSCKTGYAGVFETMHYHKSSKQVRGVSGSCFMVNSNDFRTLKGFDSNYFLTYEEIDLFRRFTLNNRIIYYDRDILIKHLHGFTSQRIMLTQAYSSMSYFLSKYYKNIKSPVEMLVLFWLMIKSLLTGDTYAFRNFLKRK
ncbi:MAG: glycosyltransferase [candidate division WOR-3 bacterium]|nr:glycosyltransferase [candidate division WOR-3 bacterium]